MVLNPMKLEPSEIRRVYEYMRARGHSRLTIKILMGFQPDGMDRLTILLGKGTDYDYKLLDDDAFRVSELERFIELSKTG
jgi:hypothetical protein